MPSYLFEIDNLTLEEALATEVQASDFYQCSPIPIPSNYQIFPDELEIVFPTVLPDPAEAFVYKKVANKVRPVATMLPEEFRTVRKFPHDPLADLPELPIHPPEFSPGERYTEERMRQQKVNPDGFLTAEEEKLCHWLFKTHEKAFAWSEEEKGRFRSDYFAPVLIPTIEHVPWVLKNAPIPPGIFDEVVKIIKDKISTGVYEDSSSSYRSRWFCVLKKDGRSLRIVHDLQPLNQVTIRDSALPPDLETYSESFGGRACYGMFDLFVGYDQQELDERSRDLTTFQTPLGAKRLTRIPMGWTNSVAIFHGNVVFILQEEIPHVTMPYVDDIPVKGPATRYEVEGGGHEVMKENPGIRRFVWEHLINVNRIIHRMRKAGGTFLGKKSDLCIPEVIIVGTKCTYEGRRPDESRIQKIRDWPPCKNVSDVRGFLGTVGTVQIFIKNFAIHAGPLVQLTRKSVPFEFGAAQLRAMNTLKHLAVTSPAIRAIDYRCDREVILAVDSSWKAVGFVLSQLGADGKRYPSRFGSITWNEREQRYSQPKIELYGLFRALRNLRIYLIGVENLVVEVDAKYIKGMINNPDFQPSNTINRWIAGILLFDFKLRHVPGRDHSPADGLSRRARAEEDEEEEGDQDEWLDEAYGFMVEVDMGRIAQGREEKEGPLVCKVGGEEVEEYEAQRNEKAGKREKELWEVLEFLNEPQRPANMDDEEFRRLVRRAADYFVFEGRMWRRDAKGRHKVVVFESERRLKLLRESHDGLGHKGFFSVRLRLQDRFWWPFMDDDLRWFLRTCHDCQVRSRLKFLIPPTVPTPPSLFRKVHIDTFLMPRAGGFRYVVHARDALSSWPEWRKLRVESGRTLGAFIFEDILCRWGAVEMIVTDNGTPFVKALDYLADKYGIRHIKISPYNSRAQGLVERRHYDVRESLIKAAGGDESRWYQVDYSVFWAERVTIQKSTGYSPFYMAHGTEPLLPFDIEEATYLSPALESPLNTQELIIRRAIQLQKRGEDLEKARQRLKAARWASARQMEKDLRTRFRDFRFQPGALVLVRNSAVEGSLDRKTKPKYFGPMVVVRRTRGGSYVLGEVDGTISRLRFAAFRLIPYYARTKMLLTKKHWEELGSVEVETETHESPIQEVDWDEEEEERRSN